MDAQPDMARMQAVIRAVGRTIAPYDEAIKNARLRSKHEAVSPAQIKTTLPTAVGVALLIGSMPKATQTDIVITIKQPIPSATIRKKC